MDWTASSFVWVIDALIAFTLIEALALWAWHRSGRGGVEPGDLLPNMGSGLCLMLALRAALSGAGVGVIALCISGSGLAHAWDLRRRWKHRPRPPAGMLKSRGAAGPGAAAAPMNDLNH